ncbi:MAG: ABC transporter permease [Acidimicrobiales bacterium]|nr:ABC transporter permease [Acidimicrobiales bacterium]
MLLASREILRAKVRFGLLAGAVGLLVFLILFQQALLGGLVTSFIGAVDNQDAPVLVFNEQARRNVEGSFLRDDQVEAVRGVAGVAAAEPIGEATYTVEAGGELVDGVLFGYPLDGPGLGAPTSLTEGRLPTAPGEAVASAADEAEGFAIGDVVRVVGDGGPEIEIVGRGEDLRWSVAPTMFVDFSTFEQAQLAANPEATAVLPSLVAVRPADGVDLDVLTDRIDESVDGVEALTNDEAVSSSPGVSAVNQSFRIILALAFGVVTLVVAFFFLILTVQKAKPLTLLRAVGAPVGYLVGNLVAQIVVVMLVGIVIGIGLVLLTGSLTTGGAIEVQLEPGTVVPTVAGLTVLALVGGLAAVRRVLRIEPIRATVDTGSELA